MAVPGFFRDFDHTFCDRAGHSLPKTMGSSSWRKYAGAGLPFPARLGPGHGIFARAVSSPAGMGKKSVNGAPVFIDNRRKEVYTLKCTISHSTLFCLYGKTFTKGVRVSVKENKYDEPVFFEKYSQMGRSVQGLSGAGEWPVLKALLPDLQGKRVLDLGCGYGWHCVYAAEHGAEFVLGTDISERMLQVARQKTQSPAVRYCRTAMEDLTCEPKSFDLVLSSLAFHYIEDFEMMVKKIYSWLPIGGLFLFSAEHPVFTAQGAQDWVYNEKGEILHFPVDNYYYEGKRSATFLGEPVVKYHRTLTTYLETLIRQGFQIRHVVEPQPPAEMLELPGMKDEMRRPMMLIISAQK